MLKKMKYSLAIVLAAMMVMSFVACQAQPAQAPSQPEQNQPAEAATAPEAPAEAQAPADGLVKDPTIKVGFAVTAAGSTHEMSLLKVVREAAEGVGGEMILDNNMVYTPEGQIASVENLIQAGANIISFCAVTGDATLAKVMQICEQNKVYLAVWDTEITDPDVKKAIEANPYFVGNTNENQIQAGYDSTKVLADAGAKNVVIVKLNDGMAALDQREEGVRKAADEFGMKVVYKIINPEDPAKAMQDVLTANPEVDSVEILGVSRRYATPIVNTIQNSGKNIIVGCHDFTDEMAGLLDSGIVKVFHGGHAPTAYFATMMAINKYMGTPLGDGPTKITIPYLIIKDSAQVEDYFDYVAAKDLPLFSVEETQNLLKKANPNLTLADMQAFCDLYSLDWVKAKNTK